MYLSKGSFKNVFVRDEYVFTKNALIAETNNIISRIVKRGVKRGDCVLAFISNESYLISSLLAFESYDLVCVILNPKDEKVDIKSIIALDQPKLIVTEKKYATIFNSFNINVVHIDDDDKNEIISITPSNFQTGNIKIYSEGNLSQMINCKEKEFFFTRMDSLIKADQEIFKLSTNISYSNFLIEFLWAISRGITVVLDDLNPNMKLSAYTVVKSKDTMNFGLFYFGSADLSNSSDKYSLLFETIKYADTNNFSAVWTPERHFNEFGGLYPNPSLLSAAIAMVTNNVSIRSGSLVSPLHHAVRIAEDLSLVDNLSKGRVGVSFASGWQCDDFVFYPENYSDRHEVMVQQIEMVKKLWNGEKVSFKNGLQQETDIQIFPKPVQEKLPVWVTVSGKVETFIDAGKIGANILTHLLWQDTDELIMKVAAYRNSLKENGYDPRSRQVSVMIHTFLGEDNDEVKTLVREPLKKYILSSTNLIQSMVKSNVESKLSKHIGGRYGSIDAEISEEQLDELAEIAFNRFFDHAGLLGTVEKSELMIKKLKSYDIDELACLLDFGMSQQEVLKGLKYLNTLKNKYIKYIPPKFPITITHCTDEEFQICLENEELREYLKGQTVIVSGNKFNLSESIPFDIKIMDIQKKIMEQSIESMSNEISRQKAFVSEVSEDF